MPGGYSAQYGRLLAALEEGSDFLPGLGLDSALEEATPGLVEEKPPSSRDGARADAYPSSPSLPGGLSPVLPRVDPEDGSYPPSPTILPIGARESRGARRGPPAGTEGGPAPPGPPRFPREDRRTRVDSRGRTAGLHVVAGGTAPLLGAEKAVGGSSSSSAVAFAESSDIPRFHFPVSTHPPPPEGTLFLRGRREARHRMLHRKTMEVLDEREVTKLLEMLKDFVRRINRDGPVDHDRAPAAALQHDPGPAPPVGAAGAVGGAPLQPGAVPAPHHDVQHPGSSFGGPGPAAKELCSGPPPPPVFHYGPGEAHSPECPYPPAGGLGPPTGNTINGPGTLPGGGSSSLLVGTASAGVAPLPAENQEPKPQAEVLNYLDLKMVYERLLAEMPDAETKELLEKKFGPYFSARGLLKFGSSDIGLVPFFSYVVRKVG